MRPASSYVWDDKTQQFAHASGIVVATPDGRLARYFFGIEYAPRDVKFALIESSAGRIGNAIDKLLLYCYHYDPATGSYGFVAMGAVRLGGARDRDRARGIRDRVASPRRVDSRAERRRTVTLWMRLLVISGAGVDASRRTSMRSISSSIAVSAFFALVVAVSVIVFGVKYRRRHDGEVGARIEGNLPLELLWSVIPTIIAMVMFGWGASVFYHLRRPPDEAMQIYAVGKQWMWKFQHLEGQREINELHVPTRTPDQDHDDVRGRAAQPVLPGIPHEDGRDSRALHDAVVRGDQGRDVSHLLRRILRHQSLGDDRPVVVLEPAAYQAWLAGGGEGLAGRARRGSSSSSWRATRATSIRARAAARRSRTSSASRSSCRTDRPSIVDEAYLRESILNSQAKIVKGFQPLMPTFQGLISEEGLVALIEHVKSHVAAAVRHVRRVRPAGCRGAAGPPTPPPKPPAQQ